jgi:hypothetical protein
MLNSFNRFARSRQSVTTKPHLQTVIVDGPIATAMRKFMAAQRGEIGTQILSFSQLAARLAGGFKQPITSEILDPAIQQALKEKAFRDIDQVCELPGMTRAVARSLRKAWEADVDLAVLAEGGAARLHDLAEIERRVRTKLPPAMMLPGDLCKAAVARKEWAPTRLPGSLRRRSLPALCVES